MPLSVSSNFNIAFVIVLCTGLTARSRTHQCRRSSGLNNEHQFNCCYTNRHPNCDKVCIENQQVCDGIVDCPDGRDEWTSLCSLVTCKLGYKGNQGFLCQNTWKRCLSLNRFCDEDLDCVSEQAPKDKSDESDCDCFTNQDCPDYGNISATFPPKTFNRTIGIPEPCGMGCDDHNSKPVIVVIVIIIAVLLIITTALCAFVVKKQCLRLKARNRNPNSTCHLPPSNIMDTNTTRRTEQNHFVPGVSVNFPSPTCLTEPNVTLYADDPPSYDQILHSGNGVN